MSRYQNLCAVVLDVYITGGLGDDNKPAYKDVWRYHMPTAQWIRLPINLRKEVYFHATAISAVS